MNTKTIRLKQTPTATDVRVGLNKMFNCQNRDKITIAQVGGREFSENETEIYKSINVDLINKTA